MYKQKTKKYQFPVVGYGDTIEPESELAKWQVLENLILACLQGKETAVFGEGEVVLERDSSGKLFMVMYPGGTGVICRGISNGVYFEAKKPVKWGPLSHGCFYYAYITANYRTFRDPSVFEADISEIKPTSSKSSIIATIDTRKDVYTVDRYPPGKNNPESLYLHIQDNDNPHGELLIQRNMNITDSLTAHSVDAETLRVKSLMLGDTEIKFGDKRYSSDIKTVHLQNGKNTLTDDKGRKICFAQLLNPDNDIKFEITDNGLDVMNSGSDKTVTVCLTVC